MPVLVGDPVQCKALTEFLLDRFSIYVQPINYPTVSRGTERIRLTPGPMHTEEQMDHLVHALPCYVGRNRHRSGYDWCQIWAWPDRGRRSD